MGTLGLASDDLAQGIPNGNSCMAFSPLSQESFPIPAAVAPLQAASMVDG